MKASEEKGGKEGAGWERWMVVFWRHGFENEILK
jgi:hypothetical protein